MEGCDVDSFDGAVFEGADALLHFHGFDYAPGRGRRGRRANADGYDEGMVERAGGGTRLM